MNPVMKVLNVVTITFAITYAFFIVTGNQEMGKIAQASLIAIVPLMAYSLSEFIAFIWEKLEG